jgi:serine/threonine-protein kinase
VELTAPETPLRESTRREILGGAVSTEAKTLQSEQGATFGRYVLGPSLGRGATGEVFRAYDLRLERDVAIKILPATEARTDGRLLDEARAAAAIQHENVAVVFDVGVAGGTPYITMEFIAGSPLRAFVGAPSVAVEQRIAWTVGVARALAAAHRQGVVHGDVKPENVMIRTDGQVKVVDFGLARRARADRAAAGPASTGGAPPVAAGTPRYMSPEHVWGTGIDARSDQFSWAVLTYEVVSGALPWQSAHDDGELVTAIVSQRPPVLRGVPDGVAFAVGRALAKAPDDRFASMDDIVRLIG